MLKTTTQMVVDGYPSGETDFLVRLGLSDVQVANEFDSQILQPLLAVLSSANESAVLTITGHSDRVDTEGLTREQRRQQEFDASEARANSAAGEIQEMIRANFLGFIPDDFDELQQLAILPRAAGAAVLREHGEVLSEDQRRRNRRVQLRVVRFQPA